MPNDYEVIIEGDDVAAAGLREAPGLFDLWLRDVVEDTAEEASNRLRARAPGSIDMLVQTDHVERTLFGFEAVAGVIPDVTEENFLRGLGSDPADWPVFPDVGTGVHGEFGKPIETIPGTYPMSWVVGNARVFAWKTEGQRAQHYSDKAYEDTVGWLPGRIELVSTQVART